MKKFLLLSALLCSAVYMNADDVQFDCDFTSVWGTDGAAPSSKIIYAPATDGYGIYKTSNGVSFYGVPEGTDITSLKNPTIEGISATFTVDGATRTYLTRYTDNGSGSSLSTKIPTKNYFIFEPQSTGDLQIMVYTNNTSKNRKVFVQVVHNDSIISATSLKTPCSEAGTDFSATEPYTPLTFTYSTYTAGDKIYVCNYGGNQFFYGLRFTKNIYSGIKDVSAQNETNKKGIYNMQGVRMRALSTDKLTPGIYIVNGKKMAIK